jgi:hypothetical protein
MIRAEIFLLAYRSRARIAHLRVARFSVSDIRITKLRGCPGLAKLTKRRPAPGRAYDREIAVTEINPFAHGF